MTGWHEQQISSSTESILTHSTQANQEKIKLDHLCLGFVFNLHTKSSFQSTFVPAQKKHQSLVQYGTFLSQLKASKGI